jgi:hypothetical protein
MIVRSIDALVMLAGGFIVGWLLVPETQPLPPPVEPAPVDEPALSVPAAPEPQVAPADCPEAAVVEPPPPPVPQATLQPPLPEVYQRIVGPTTAELGGFAPYVAYANFAREPRDEAWATAMEAGMGDWADRVASPESVRIDYAECRTRSCIVAGHAETGDTTILGRLTAEGWWQATGSVDIRMRSARNDSADFVVFVHRYAN